MPKRLTEWDTKAYEEAIDLHKSEARIANTQLKVEQKHVKELRNKLDMLKMEFEEFKEKHKECIPKDELCEFDARYALWSEGVVMIMAPELILQMELEEKYGNRIINLFK